MVRERNERPWADATYQWYDRAIAAEWDKMVWNRNTIRKAWKDMMEYI